MLIKTPSSRRFENIHPINGGFELGPDTEKFLCGLLVAPGKESPSQTVSTEDDRKRS